jgi:uncharacterized protein
MFTLETNNQHYVMISGATGGLGRAFAVECAGRGWNLFLTDLSAAALETLADGLRRAYGVEVITQACDLTDPAARAALLDSIHAERLRFGWLINVAGIDYEGPFFEQSARQIRTIIRLNVEGTLELTHGLLAYRDPRAPFHIINVASLAAFQPMPVKATYAASKRFLLDFSLALREELRETGATVTALCPAGLHTNPGAREGIAAQGWLGTVTTMNTGAVAYQTVEAALANRPIVIPGAVNQVVQALGGLLPTALVVKLVASRWRSARERRELAAA